MIYNGDYIIECVPISKLEYTIPSSYNCTHACDFLCGTTHIYNCGPREVKAVVHDHAWFKATRDLKPPVV